MRLLILSLLSAFAAAASACSGTAVIPSAGVEVASSPPERLAAVAEPNPAENAPAEAPTVVVPDEPSVSAAEEGPASSVLAVEEVVGSDEAVGSEPSTVARQPPTEPFNTAHGSLWEGPAGDPYHLVARLDRYRMGTTAAALAASEPVEAECVFGYFNPAGLARWHGTWSRSAGLEIYATIHRDHHDAALFAGDLPEAWGDCWPGELAAMDAAAVGIDPERFQAWFDESGRLLVSTHHGSVSLVIQARGYTPPGDRSPERLHDLIREIDLVFGEPLIAMLGSAAWSNNAEAESMLIEGVGYAAFAFDEDELACFAEQMTELVGRGVEISLVIAGEVGVYCGPRAVIEGRVRDVLRPAHLIADEDRRRCFEVTTWQANTAGTFDDFLDRRLAHDGHLDPTGLERRELEQRLSQECGVDPYLAAMAGLPTVGPIDDSLEREAFCAGMSDWAGSRQGVSTSADGRLVELREERARDAELSIPEPLRTVFEQRERRSAALIDLIEATGAVGNGLRDEAEYQRLTAELDFSLMDLEVDQYIRINC